MSPIWPEHRYETLPWQQNVRGGTREDRMLRSIAASIPPFIAAEEYLPGLVVLREMEEAVLAVRSADVFPAAQSSAISRFMIRSESIASSKIERISASAEEYARALAGNRGNASATSMVAASRAMHALITDVGESGTFTLSALLNAHRALMVDDPHEAAYAGRTRNVQNWIGGSDYSPRDGLHVPPAAVRVDALMRDLLEFSNRDDLPVMVQAAIAHAQFESVHAFTDGNGRIGRALVGAVLRRRGVARNTVVPLASGLLAERDAYFDSLTEYRRGDPEPIILLLCRSAKAGAEESLRSMQRIAELPELWRESYAPRAGSAGAKLLRAFFDHPVLSGVELEALGLGAASSVNAALDAMREAGIVEEITGRKRDRVWAASDLIAELDELDRRIQRRMLEGRPIRTGTADI